MSNPDSCSEQLCHISNTMAVPCRAETVFVLNSEQDLPTLSDIAKSYCKVRFVGSASNLLLPPVLGGLTVLVRNHGISLVRQSGAFRYVDVAAGEIWHDWVDYAISQGWSGLENLALIPGTVGAAPVQNIGAYGVEVERFIESVRVWNLQKARFETLDRKACDFQYRDSIFKRSDRCHLLIVSVRFALPVVWAPVLGYPDLASIASARAQGHTITARQIFDEVVAIRKRKLPEPALLPNAGSFFKNPVVSHTNYEEIRRANPGLVAYQQSEGAYKLAAGWLIDQCGWKGRQVGPVRVHERQALVLTNTAGATQADVLNVARMIQADVKKQFGVSLEIEPDCWER